jgi:AcrR family transcriptional regulator
MTDSVKRADEPAPRGTRRAEPADEPAPRGTRRAQPADKPAQRGTRRAQQADEPAQPRTPRAKQADEPAQPGTRRGKPAAEPAQRETPRITRAEQARATRRRIIAAATAQFVEHGYGATLLEQVAEQAGVAVQTVYFHFGNKRTLLKEALDVAAVGDDEPVALLERPWLTRIHEEKDPRRVIELWLANGRGILERVAPLMRVVRGAVGTDPELAAQWATNQQQTRTAYAVLAGLLAERRALRPGMDVGQARDIAFVIANVESYLQFSDACGWTLDQWQERTGAILAGALLCAGAPPGCQPG